MKLLNNTVLRVLLISCLAAVTLQARAQESGVLPRAEVSFRVNSTVLEESFNGNGERLEAFAREVERVLSDPTSRVSGMIIEAGASPEGDPAGNERLAIGRAHSIRAWLAARIPEYAPRIGVYAIGADWEGLRRMVAESSSPWKDEILSAIEQCGVLTGYDSARQRRCQAQLKSIGSGRAWDWLMADVFPALRQGNGVVRFISDEPYRVVSQRDTIVIIHEYEGPDSQWYLDYINEISRQTQDRAKADVLDAIEKKPRRRALDSLWKEPVVAFRSNLLLPLMNVGVELPLTNRVSVNASVHYPWVWRSWMDAAVKPEHSECFELHTFGLGARYWLGASHRMKDEYRKYRLRGHSLGVYVDGGYYDLQHDWVGRQGEYLAAGIGYLYALPLGKGRVHLEFELAAGWAFGRYRGYQVHQAGGRLMGNYQDGTWNSPVPMRAAVNIAVPLFRREKFNDIKVEDVQ